MPPKRLCLERHQAFSKCLMSHPAAKSSGSPRYFRSMLARPLFEPAEFVNAARKLTVPAGDYMPERDDGGPPWPLSVSCCCSHALAFARERFAQSRTANDTVGVPAVSMAIRYLRRQEASSLKHGLDAEPVVMQGR